jgi:hypothetical protein
VFARRDPLKIDPKHYHLDFENEHVRAIRLTLKADEAVPMHDDVDAMAVCIEECHLRFTRIGRPHSGRPHGKRRNALALRRHALRPEPEYEPDGDAFHRGEGRE